MTGSSLRISTLGTTTVLNPAGHTASSLVAQPKRLALLVYMAVVSRETGGVSRDRLYGVFWPDSSPDRASHNLTHSLGFIKRALGPDVITGKGPYSIADNVRCDASEFLDACAANQHDRALSLYTGDFLDGFAVADAGDFEQWAENQRTRLRTLATNSARALRDDAIERGKPAEAAPWSQKAVELSDYNERDAQHLIRILVAIGDRPGALRAFKKLRDQMREILDDEPSEETGALLNPDVKREALPIVLVEGPRREATEMNAPLPAVERKWYATSSAVLVTALSVVLSVSLAGLWGSRANVASKSIDTSAVVTVEPVSARADLDARASALTTELIDKLRVDNRVRTRASDMGESLVREDQGYVLRTAIVDKKGIPTASVSLFDASSGVTLHHVDVNATTPVDSIARAIVTSMRRAIGRNLKQSAFERRIQKTSALRLVHAAYLEQLRSDSLKRDGARDAAELSLVKADSLLAAVTETSGFASELLLARASIAYERMWVRLMTGDKPAAHAAAADGLALAERAIQITRDNAEALEAAGSMSHWLSLTTPRDSADAERAMVKMSKRYLLAAVKADAQRPYAWSLLSSMLLREGQYQEAYYTASQARLADVFEEYTSDIDVRLFESALQAGNVADARRACRDFTVDDGSGYFSSYCQLRTIAWVAASSQPSDELVDSLAVVMGVTPRERVHLQVIKATYYAARGDLARARAVAAPVTSRGSIEDPELMRLAAWYYTVAGEYHNASDLLQLFASTATHEVTGILNGSEYAPLRRTAGR